MKYAWLILGGIVSSVYAAFVAICLWNWFATGALRLPPVSFLEMLGLLWLIGLLTSRNEDTDAHRWTELWAGIEYLTGDKRRPGLAAARRDVNDTPTLMWIPMGRLLGNTVTLAMGFVVHLLVM
jgi:hypothetical protein